MILFTLLCVGFLLWLASLVILEVRNDPNLPFKTLVRDVVIGLGVILTLILVLL